MHLASCLVIVLVLAAENPSGCGPVELVGALHVGIVVDVHVLLVLALVVGPAIRQQAAVDVALVVKLAKAIIATMAAQSEVHMTISRRHWRLVVAMVTTVMMVAVMVSVMVAVVMAMMMIVMTSMVMMTMRHQMVAPLHLRAAGCEHAKADQTTEHHEATHGASRDRRKPSYSAMLRTLHLHLHGLAVERQSESGPSQEARKGMQAAAEPTANIQPPGDPRRPRILLLRGLCRRRGQLR